MPWFLCPYKRDTVQFSTSPVRYCAMNDFTTLIKADGGAWSETEVLGNHAIVKVLANATTLATIAAAPGFTRLPKDLLDSPLSDLTNPQKIALRDKIESLGYPREEWQADLGADLGTKTLRDVLRFIAKRRRKPRYDSVTDSIALDGPIQSCRAVEHVDGTVS